MEENYMKSNLIPVRRLARRKYGRELYEIAWNSSGDLNPFKLRGKLIEALKKAKIIERLNKIIEFLNFG